MPTQPHVSVQLVWSFVSRICSGATNSQNTRVFSAVVLRSLMFLFFFAAWATAAESKPFSQADALPADSHSSAALPSADAKQPPATGAEDAKPSSDKKDAPSHDPMPASAQGERPRTPPPAIEPSQM